MGKDAKPALFLPDAKKYIDTMSDADRGTLARDILALASSETDAISIKLLQRPVFELIIGHHRFTYFWLHDCLYIVRGFRKKSAKTPKREIEYAQKIFKQLQNQ